MGDRRPLLGYQGPWILSSIKDTEILRLFLCFISLLTLAAADAGGLRSAFPGVLCNFGSSDRNNTLIRAALWNSELDSVEMPWRPPA